MTKYFGTDGVRGRANDTLTCEMAFRIGRYVGWYYGQDKQAKIVIGKDTRLSSDMFEMALATGAIASGASVYLLGVCPTPSVSYLIQKENFDCGIMVSASHNPYYDNGIKLFNGKGKKMDLEVEEKIESFMDQEIEVPFALNQNIGRVYSWSEGLTLYKNYVKNTIHCDLSGLNIVLDLANGSATSCAKEVLEELQANVTVIHSDPDGININTNCGSTHPNELQSVVKEGNYDAGFAFDGDADRLICVNEQGELVTGDHILYICGKYMKKCHQLRENMVVTTVMANLGLYKAFDKQHIRYEQTPVGDKYVFECMDKNQYSLGGEQSGHIIFYEYANTGDGLLSALQMLQIMKVENASLKQLSEGLKIYPQLLKNVIVKDKNVVIEDPKLHETIQKVEQQLEGNGRILVRTSGTEPLVRVMVEAESDEICRQCVNQVVDYIENKYE